MKITERIILFLSVALNTLLLVWVITLQDRIYDTREALIKFEAHVVKFMEDTNSSINHHTNAIRSIAGLPKDNR